MARAWVLFASVCLAGALGPSPTLAQVRVGSEFQVNTYTTAFQRYPSVAADSDGDFVVAWTSNGQDGSGYGVFARRFSSAGVTLGGEFQVNTYTAASQQRPDVAAEVDGDFVIVWHSYGQDGPGHSVFARRFSSAGVTLGGEFQVNTTTYDHQSNASVAADDDGDFVVAWTSDSQDADSGGVFARRFSSAGVALGGEFQVNTYTTGHQRIASVAVDDDGDFAVAWTSDSQDGSERGVFARRFSSAGGALGGEFQVNTHTTARQSNPSVVMDTDGELIVAWYSGNGHDGSGYGVFARRFSSTGVGLGGEFQVNTFTTNSQAFPSVATQTDGEFVVIWHSGGQDGSSYGVFARRFSSAGLALGLELQVNTYTPQNQKSASVAANDDGDFVVAWESSLQDGSSYGVFVQRFGASAPAAPLDIDGNGGTPDALTDGLLVLRFLFGFTGPTLISGAVSGGCTQCDATSILTRLNGLGSTLDIDGNGGPLGALTDGLLVLRFLFGFSGTSLTSGAVGAGCTRCDAAAITSYLTGLLS